MSSCVCDVFSCMDREFLMMKHLTCIYWQREEKQWWWSQCFTVVMCIISHIYLAAAHKNVRFYDVCTVYLYK